MNSYKTISQNLLLEIAPIKKSRFITQICFVENEQDILDNINIAKSTYKDANHYCWAYSLIKNNKFRFSDDGEPSGSAGKPILSHIHGYNLFNVLVIVIRYFGGTKLGVGGLIRAYGQATKEAIDLAEVIEVQPKSNISVRYDYSETTNVELVMKRYSVKILSEYYSDCVVLDIRINVSDKIGFIDELTNATKGNVKVEEYK